MPAPGPLPKESLTLAETRRLALAAQGFGQRRTDARSPWPRVAAIVERMGLLQLDSVSALVRTHYLPAFSRLGNYDRSDLDRRAFAPDRRQFFEYWAHEASLLPLALHPFMRWRMERAKRLKGIYGGLARFAQSERAYLRSVREEIRQRGPLAASDLADPGKRGGSWWGWHKGKTALEFLFWTGEVTTASRRGFERIYDFTESVLPETILALPTPAEHEAIRELTRRAAVALGIGTEGDIRDYFRLPVADARRAIRELVDEGSLIPVQAQSWRQTAYMPKDAAIPGRLSPSALISPFDPLVWHRQRTERLFGFHYRVEIYTPAAKRRFGYYVLPFLDRGRLSARVDLKSDRAAGVLEMRGAHAEPGTDLERSASALSAELRRLADWLGLAEVRLTDRGDLARHLQEHFKKR